MSGNRGVVYIGPGKVEVQNIPFSELVDPAGRKANQFAALAHGAMI